MHQKLDEQAALAAAAAFAAAATRSAIGGHGSLTVAADGGGSGDYSFALPFVTKDPTTPQVCRYTTL